MNIALFVQGYLPEDVYGIPRHVERLSKYLSQNGHKVWIITKGNPILKKREQVNPNLIIFRTFHLGFKKFKRLSFISSFWNRQFYTLMSIIEGIKLIRQNKIQILHGHHLEYGGKQAILTGRFLKLPSLVTVHGSGLDYYSGYPKIPLKLNFLKRKHIKIICQKRSAINILEKWRIPEKKIEYITEAFVDTETFNPRMRKPHKKFKYITFIGRLIGFKGPDLLIDAIPLIIQKYHNVRFLIVGEGSLLPSLKQRTIELGIQKHVKFLGLIRNIKSIYSITDIAVSLSKHENFTDMALLEALAFGIPIVATNVGETGRIIKDNVTGLLSDCNAEDIANKILALLHDPEFGRDLGINGRNLIKKEYLIKKFGLIHEKLYYSLISEMKKKT